ncbi:hypothetical protein PTSG_08478 [Salpingoeca rosetta]|uniref:D-aminoacyl-tRNA deacylase n=1 Tax=Salpingoeca rosetta (strain ATCC 50818 / BSB-021) TaxID=946362 RepID=F2UJT4_SALR5|nr:uncharacterized protein PTSG_08478 [Salpingoeca rosetta]EGD77383.1 hypothetical protein PTSG_08478 [Salpingoeca rosetta]|eukprot:XP_004990727.1 hypothetical protein PTSG_08478 [Salpingoeca rosetta]
MPVTVVLQKTNGVELQVDPDEDEWVKIGKGVIIFVAFLKDTTADQLPAIVKKLLHLKYCERASILEQRRDVLLVPQATLGGKIKGKQLQYHGNVSKDEGRDLFMALIAEFQKQLEEAGVGDSITFKHGTYGNIQRMRNMSNDGPFTHTFTFPS